MIFENINQLNIKKMKDGDMFYANGEYHYVIGNLAVDKKTNESYIYDESGKRWYESELLYK